MAASVDPVSLAFGRRVRTLRVQAGLTQVKLQAMTGITSVNISRIESGQIDVQLTTILRLAAALEVADINELVPPKAGAGHSAAAAPARPGS